MIDIGVGPGLTGPTLIHHGTEAQKRRFLPRILTGDDVWCQGFSEPNAGSDLAALPHARRARRRRLPRHRARRSGPATPASPTGASWSCARIRKAPKHKGLTFLLVDMKSPGITIRPLVEMTGVAWFNEVFFDDVRVPRENMVGALNEGWTIAITTLAHERGGSAPHARLAGELHDGARRWRAAATACDATPRWRQRLAQSYIETEIVRLVAYKQVSDLMRTGQPGPEGSYLKLLWSETDMRMKDAGDRARGAVRARSSAATRSAVDAGRWQYEYLWSRAASIYAGTSEVQRNIIAQRVLGLPRG